MYVHPVISVAVKIIFAHPALSVRVNTVNAHPVISVAVKTHFAHPVPSVNANIRAQGTNLGRLTSLMCLNISTMVTACWNISMM
jgi:hypothetical protein